MKRITKRTWTPLQEARLTELADSGASIIRISAALNKTVSAIRGRAKELGVDIRSFREIRKAIRDAAREAPK